MQRDNLGPQKVTQAIKISSPTGALSTVTNLKYL